MKHYILIDEDKAFLEKHVKRKEIRERFSGFRPFFYRFSWMNNYPEKAYEIFEAGRIL